MQRSFIAGDPRESTALSVHRTYVVQLHPGAVDGRYSGRVEHVASGRAAQFASLEALLSFLEQDGAHPVEERAADRTASK